MSYEGDYALGATFYFNFETLFNNVLTTLAGSPSLVAYADDNVVQFATGLTLTTDFDGVVGTHNVKVVATSGNGFASGVNYCIRLAAGTVAGLSAVGRIVGEFSIEKTAAVSRLPAALTAGGRMKASVEAILDTAFTEGAAGRIAAAFKSFFNIAAPTLTVADVNQTGDAYGIVSDATAGNTALSNRIPAALVGGRMVSHVAAFAAAVIDSGAFASSATASIADAVWNRNPKGGADGVAGTSRAGDAVASGFMFFAIDGAGNLVVKHTDGTQASARAIGRFVTAMNAIQTGT